MKSPVVCLILATSLASVQAKTIFVSADSGLPAAPYGSWSTAANHLQTALATATAGDQIWVAAGTYFPDAGTGQTANSRSSTFALIGGVEMYGGFGGTETLLTQRAPAARVTILSGDLDQNDCPDFSNNSNNAYHVVFASAGSNIAVLDGFTITAGNANGPQTNPLGLIIDNKGGGLLCLGASPVIRNCSFTGNSADEGGGAAEVASSPSFINCSFSGNSAKNGAGGGGIFSENGSPTLTNCTVFGNYVSGDGNGGGILSNDSSPTLTNCTVFGNVSRNFGGGIYITSSISRMHTLTNCSISGNQSLQEGGGIYNYTADASLTNCIVWNNSPDSQSFASSDSHTYSHCLIQGQNLSAATGGNLDGTLPANDPRFFIPGDPQSAPFTGANLRLKPGSPAIDRGDGVSGSSANTQALDSAGKPRFVDGADGGGTIAAAIIDMGAYEDNPLDRDYDLDGILDHTEATLVSLGFIIGTNDSGKLALLQANAPTLGLYTQANFQALALSRPVISRDPGSGMFRLRTQLLRSPDLVTPFVPFSAYTATQAPGSSELLLEFAPPTPDAHFFQIQIGN